MDSSIVTHVFCSIQALEKLLENSRKMLVEQRHQPLSVHTAVLQQARALRAMRQSANNLQLEVARKDWISAVRSLQIYYGLNSLVRPEIVTTFSALSNGEICLQLQDNQAMYH